MTQSSAASRAGTCPATGATVRRQWGGCTWAQVRGALKSVVQRLPALLADQLDVDGDRREWLVHNVCWALSRGIDHVPHDGSYTEDDLYLFRLQGEQQAVQNSEIGELGRTYRLALIVFQRELWAFADEHNVWQMERIARWYLRELARGTEAAELAYASSRRARGDLAPLRDLTMRHLLDGTALAGVAANMTPLAESYLVVLITAPVLTDTESQQARLFLQRLDLRPDVLRCGAPGELLLLLPAADDLAGVRSSATRMVARLAGQRVRAAQAYRPGLEHIPEAVAEARLVSALVELIPDAASRPYRLDELMVDLAVARQPALAGRLAALLRPLAEGPALPETLDALFAYNFDRQQVARALHVHPRTVTYRMARIGELLGIEPDSAHGIQLLRTALMAQRLGQVGADTIVTLADSVLGDELHSGALYPNGRPQPA